MGSYSIGYWGVDTEAAWGTSDIVGAGSTAYWLGVIAQNPGQHPWAEKSYQRGAPSPLQEYSTTIYRTVLLPRATVSVALLDAVPIWYAMGESANAGAGAPYTHDLTFRDGSGAAMPDPPSFTWHRELVDPAGVLTDDRLQVTGLRVESFRLSCYGAQSSGYLLATMGLVGKQHDDTVAFSLTTKPAARIASKAPFNFRHLTTKTLAANDIAGLRGFDLWWTRPIIPEWQHRTVGGANASHLVYAHRFGDLDGPYLRLEVEPEDFEKIGFDDIDTTTPAKDLSLVFTRAANDTITFTGTNWHPARGRDPIRLPTRVPPVVLEGPLELLTCAVTDSLAGATHYA